MRRRSFVASLAAAVLALGVVTPAALATANGDPELEDLASPTVVDEAPSDDVQTGEEPESTPEPGDNNAGDPGTPEDGDGDVVVVPPSTDNDVVEGEEAPAP